MWLHIVCIYLAILLQVVVQNLRVGLLVRGQDVHEGGWSVASGSWGIDGTAGPQRRGDAERSSRRPGMETLLFKRLRKEAKKQNIQGLAFRPPKVFVILVCTYLRLCVNRSRNVWHSCVA